MSDKAKQIASLLSPTVQALGLELLGAEYLPAPGSATLRLYIDVPEALRLMDDEGLASLQSELEKLLRQIKNLDEGFGMQPLPFTE